MSPGFSGIAVKMIDKSWKHFSGLASGWATYIFADSDDRFKMYAWPIGIFVGVIGYGIACAIEKLFTILQARKASVLKQKKLNKVLGALINLPFEERLILHRFAGSGELSVGFDIDSWPAGFRIALERLISKKIVQPEMYVYCLRREVFDKIIEDNFEIIKLTKQEESEGKAYFINVLK